MNRFLTILLFIAITSELSAQDYPSLSFSFNDDDFNLKEFNDGAFITSRRYKLSFSGDTLTPAVPFFCVNVLVSPDCSYDSIKFTVDEKLFEKNVVLAKTPAAVNTFGMINTSTRDDISSAFNGFINPEPVNFGGLHTIDGYRYITLIITPFRYDINEGNLYLRKRIEGTLYCHNESDQIRHGITTSGNNMYNFVRNSMLNGMAIDSLYPNSIRKTDFLKSTSGNNYEYLIITADSLRQSFERLARWKSKKGIKTGIVSIEDICSASDTYTKALEIKAFLKSHYDGTISSSLKYVLLAGDAEIVPAVLCFGYNSEAADSTNRSNIPADLFYQCLDTLDWDNNHNGLIGEISDSISINANIFLTRAPVRNHNDANTFVNKVIGYEQHPVYNHNILMSGVRQSKNPHYWNSGHSDVEAKGEVIYQEAIGNYWDGTRFRFYDTFTDMPGGSSYDVNVPNIQSQFSRGFSFIHMDAHGKPAFWKIENDTVFSISDVGTISSPSYSIILTSACLTNAFDSIPRCLSESFMFEENSGIIGYWGSSRYGWFYEGATPTLGPSDLFNEAFYEALFNNEEKHFGEIATIAKQSINPYKYTFYSSERWLLLGINPLGDPETPVFTSNPKSFSNVSIIINGEMISIDPHVNSCKICIMSLNDSINTSYNIFDGQVSNQQIPLSDFSICITRPEYIPYVVNVYKSKNFIQNEIIEENCIYLSPQMSIGQDVTSLIPSGNVIINNGQTIIQSQGDVVITNGFEVKKGATFEIR